MSEAKEGFDRARYEATYRITMAITDAISRMPPYPTKLKSRDIYREWIEEEEGALAVDRLVNLIIH